MISLHVVSIDVERQAIKPDRWTPLVGPAERLALKGARNASGARPKRPARPAQGQSVQPGPARGQGPRPERRQLIAR
jgi:hypothetical protein